MLHFVYAGQPNSGSLHAALQITHNLFNFLETKTAVCYHDWTSKNDVDFGPEDLLLGHPNYDTDTVVQKIFRKPHGKKCLIFPFHHGRPADNLPFNTLVHAADKVFSICGPYWYDTIDNSAFAGWKSKITRIDMAIDPIAFPFVKTEFNQRRQLLYMGSSIPNKNLPMLAAVMRAMPDVTLYWYGGDSRHPLARLKNVRTTGWVNMNHHIAIDIAKHADIIVSVSDSDANPTTLLEAMAWGLPVACTRESGYYNDQLFTELYLNDVPRTVKALRIMMDLSNEQLKARSVAGRQEVITKYTWNRFCATVWDGIKEYVK